MRHREKPIDPLTAALMILVSHGCTSLTCAAKSIPLENLSFDELLQFASHLNAATEAATELRYRVNQSVAEWKSHYR